MPNDDLLNALTSAVQNLSTSEQATLLLDIALKTIDAGKYNAQVDDFLDICLRTPTLSKDEMSRALFARAKARKQAGERALLLANQDFQLLASLDPRNRRLCSSLQPVRLSSEPASQRAPPEIWERIAQHTPKYHLRTWLFVSRFHHDIALRLIFRTLDLYFGSEDMENITRGLDIFDRAKADPTFANLVRSLRIHWAFEEGDMLDLISRMFRMAIPEFKRLREFEWIGYPELRVDMVQMLLKTHPNLSCLGLIGWHFDAAGVPAFGGLRKFTLRAEDDDGFADMNEVQQLLDNNASTLTHLILGAYLARTHSWDDTFQSSAIHNLTHLDLVDTRISHFVLVRIMQAEKLRSLTLHGTFADKRSAAMVFESDHLVDSNGGRRHTFLPELTSFRFILVGNDENLDDLKLYRSITRFVRERRSLSRLDLGECPWRDMKSILPGLKGLRVLGVHLDSEANEDALNELVSILPEQMAAIHLSSVSLPKPLPEYATLFSRFPALSFLHLRPQPNSSASSQPSSVKTSPPPHSTFDQTETVRHIAKSVPSLDFVGWYGEHYVILRGSTSRWSVQDQVNREEEGIESEAVGGIRVRELPPARRQLDCSKAVDLGSEGAMWLERKDVPIGFES